MSSRAVKFYSRAPRYTLNATDNRYMRYAASNDKGHSFTTRFIDISQTGLAFLTDRENAPRLSDLIKVEIPLDDKNTIAWWARVVRIEEYSPQTWLLKKQDLHNENEVLVAIVFHELPPSHSKLIRETLNRKFEETRERERKEQMQNLAAFFAQQAWKILIYASLIAGTIWFLYYFSRPSENYDGSKGAPWGQRYPELNLPKTPNNSPEVE
jgi:hypothetical protein